jgi:hypothetical protein
MKTRFVVTTLVSCFLLCGFQGQTSSTQQKPASKVASSNQQKADSGKGAHGAASPGQPAADAADKNATPPAPPHQNDKVEVASLPPEIAVKQVKDSIDRTIMWCTIILTIVGIVGTIAALRTLRQVKRQADTLDDHKAKFHELAKAANSNAEAAILQVRAMQEQITEMSVQSGILQESVNVSRDAAAAAKKSADALLASERAWVMAELRCRPETFLTTHASTYQGVTTHTTSVAKIELYCVNDGNSPAWITEKSARLVVVREGELPKFPELAKEDILADELEPMGPGKDNVFTWDINGKGYHSIDTATLIYGVVRYSDIFENNRETWFCYQLTGYKTNREMIRITGEPEYNKNT